MLVFGREEPETDLMEKFAWGREYLAYNIQKQTGLSSCK